MYEKETLKLYKVECRGMNYKSSGSGVAHGIAYVVATDPSSAYNKLQDYLDKNDLGFRKDRELATIELLAEEVKYPACGYHLFT